jgi:hypothetical protein
MLDVDSRYVDVLIVVFLIRMIRNTTQSLNTSPPPPSVEMMRKNNNERYR